MENSLFIRFMSFQTRSEPILLYYPPVFPANPCKYWLWRDFLINIYTPAAIYSSCIYISAIIFFLFSFPFHLNPCKCWIYSHSWQSCYLFKNPLSSSSFFHLFYTFFFSLKPYRVCISSFFMWYIEQCLSYFFRVYTYKQSSSSFFSSFLCFIFSFKTL